MHFVKAFIQEVKIYTCLPLQIYHGFAVCNYKIFKEVILVLGLKNLSDGLLNAAEKVEGINNALTAKKNAVKEAVSDKINDAKDAVNDAKDAVSDKINDAKETVSDKISDAKETVIETKENAATAIKGAARNHLKSTVQEINKNA